MSLITKSTYLRGPKGDSGLQGLKGDRGLPGPAGPQGIQGPDADPVYIRAQFSSSGNITYDYNTGVIGFTNPGYATTTYVDTAISNLISGAPDLLNTLNELSAAIGNNANFIDSVVLKTGSTMTGALILNANPTSSLQAATKQYVDNATLGVTVYSTDDVPEGTKLYYTDQRARSAISVTGSGSYNSSTGVITVTGGVTSVNGKSNDVNLTLFDLGVTDGTASQYLTTDGNGNLSFVTSAWDGAVFDGGGFDSETIIPGELVIDGGMLESYYNATNPADWSGNAPTTVQEALDRLAQGTSGGATGPQGPAGPAGADGAQGPQGIQGPQGDTGPAGADGAQGPQGDTGPAGPAGADGKTVLSGTIAPSNSVGVDGDFYINTATNYIYGPKASGTWPSGISLVGPAGATGATGATGPAGPQGIQGEQGPSGEGLINQTIILNNVAPSTAYTNAAVPEWSASYTGTGGQLLVKADIMLWASSTGTRNWYLKKNGTTVATGSFYFNNANVHTTMPTIQYVDTTGSTTAATWSITIGASAVVDTNDRATITVTEYTGVTSINVSSLTAAGNVSGSILTSTNATGNEGGEIQLAKAPNSTLSGSNVVIDQYADRVRIFEGGGTNRGAYIDLTQASASVGTLLNNRVASLVNAGTFVTMDNIKATVTSSGNRGLSLASVSGTFNINIGGNYGMAGPAAGGGAGTMIVTTTASSSVFGWNFPSQSDISTYIITDTTNGRAYRITLQIGGSYINNMISIERLI